MVAVLTKEYMVRGCLDVCIVASRKDLLSTLGGGDRTLGRDGLSPNPL